MFPCRLYVDPPADGAWNMATDEALLQRAAAAGEASLRFYKWSPPTVSLGYFQAYADRRAHAASGVAAVVRRLSGGGTLVHDRELTYSLSLPPSHLLARDPASVYALVHQALIDALADFGLHAHFHGANSLGTSGGPEPFLCFARRTSYDIVMMPMVSSRTSEFPQASGVPAKVAGSAQRRSRGALLQHGALLLARSPHAPELPGVVELTGVSLSVEDVLEPWTRRLSAQLGLELSTRETTVGAGLESAPRLVEKYASAIWTKRR